MTSLPLQPTISLGTQLTEQVVTFSAQDKKLAGHLIHAQQTEPAILFLHGWAGLRTGPHGLLTHLARNAGQSGFSSLRFDFYGRGDSGHSRSEASLDQMGMDARHALDYVLEATGATKAIVVGICSGGNVGLGALTGDPRVVGFFLMSVYPFGDGDSFGRDLNRTAHHAKGYWQKLWQRQTWKRFLRGDVSLKGVAKTLTGHWMKEPASGQKVTFPNFFDGAICEYHQTVALYTFHRHFRVMRNAQVCVYADKSV